MKSIEGIWEGNGHDISLTEGNIEKTPLKLFMEIKHIEGNNYSVKTQFFYIDGPLQTEEHFLILRNEEEFISEDATGSGINFYKFEQGFHLLGLHKLTYKYNLNGKSEWGNINGEYILHKKCNC